MTDLIIDETIVICPNEKYIYVTSVNNKLFNNRTKVELIYVPTKIFTSFETYENKEIFLYYEFEN
jgi:hypothetical protein